jgi:ferredoxin-fold anticodon binding domain-containing protein
MSMIGKHCLVRTYSAGVHIGIVETINGTEVFLKNSRRIWRWEGAFTLSEVATKGVKKTSRIAIEIPEILLTQAIEIIPTTEAAQGTFAECHE